MIGTSNTKLQAREQSRTEAAVPPTASHALHRAAATRFAFFCVFAGWFLCWFGLVGADLLWKENTVDWLNKTG